MLTAAFGIYVVGLLAGLLSMIYVACYLALSVPSVLAGAVAVNVGLPSTIVLYSVFVILAAASALVAQIVSRRATVVEDVAEDEIERQRDAVHSRTVTGGVPGVRPNSAVAGQ